MTKHEKTVRIVGRGIGIFAVLNVLAVVLLCMNDIEVGGIYHPEGWALVWGRDLPILLFLLLLPVVAALLWCRAAARLMDVRWTDSLKRVVKYGSQGMLLGLLIVLLLSVINWIRFR